MEVSSTDVPGWQTCFPFEKVFKMSGKLGTIIFHCAWNVSLEPAVTQVILTSLGKFLWTLWLHNNHKEPAFVFPCWYNYYLEL